MTRPDIKYEIWRTVPFMEYIVTRKLETGLVRFCTKLVDHKNSRSYKANTPRMIFQKQRLYLGDWEALMYFDTARIAYSRFSEFLKFT